MYAIHIALDGCPQMIDLLRGERMVAHDVADAPFLLAVMARRRTFFSRVSFDCTFHAVTDRLAKFRGGSFDRSGANLELHEAWKRHRAVELSNTDRIQAATGTRTHQPSSLEPNLVPTASCKMIMCHLPAIRFSNAPSSLLRRGPGIYAQPLMNVRAFWHLGIKEIFLGG